MRDAALLLGQMNRDGWLHKAIRSEGETMIPKLTRNRFTLISLLAVCLAGVSLPALVAKDNNKAPAVDPNDPTVRLFQTADNSKGGKLADFYLLADVYKDPALPSEEAQHILKVDYDKAKLFAKLQIVVRSVGKIQPDQMKAYTAKEFFEFGLADQAKYMKTEPGPFGKPGDMYLVSTADRPLASAAITDEVRTRYEVFVTQYLLPALDKK